MILIIEIVCAIDASRNLLQKEEEISALYDYRLGDASTQIAERFSVIYVLNFLPSHTIRSALLFSFFNYPSLIRSDFICAGHKEL